uniref:Uncharacterized protein n=1 Tax=Nelumbo nucifera TaxID=4432 RepID=A0A822Y446_NELNU|nr:TPA_asm: hypothetical protein HUJ06_027850 [Nelumbo nucifera]
MDISSYPNFTMALMLPLRKTKQRLGIPLPLLFIKSEFGTPIAIFFYLFRLFPIFFLF